MDINYIELDLCCVVLENFIRFAAASSGRLSPPLQSRVDSIPTAAATAAAVVVVRSKCSKSISLALHPFAISFIPKTCVVATIVVGSLAVAAWASPHQLAPSVLSFKA